jgi:hypothetical protein
VGGRLLAGLAQLCLADPVVEPLTHIIVPASIPGEVGTVLASSEPMPMPVIWLQWAPVPTKGRQPCAAGKQTRSSGAPNALGPKIVKVEW